MPEAQAALTILAFDFGLRRIGVAVGQTITGSASPLDTLVCRQALPDYERIAGLVREWRPDRLVVGLPLAADGTASDMSRAAEGFARELERLGLPVDRVDERHSSLEAGATLKQARQAGSRGRIRRGDIDAAAAVVIAERWLHQNRPGPGPVDASA
jgi:putative pre-16S rRNA nuclease